MIDDEDAHGAAKSSEVVDVIRAHAFARTEHATYPVLPAEGLLSDLKAAGEIQDDTFVNVGYGVLNAPKPPGVLPMVPQA